MHQYVDSHYWHRPASDLEVLNSLQGDIFTIGDLTHHLADGQPCERPFARIASKDQRWLPLSIHRTIFCTLQT